MNGESIRALFKDGVFVPQEHVSLDEGSTVELVFRPSKLQSPVVNDPGERRKVMDELIASFKRNPIPVGARQFTRDELHERR
jgi:predicted DNA-binding antitoxin AbrB/MazE fold protein